MPFSELTPRALVRQSPVVLYTGTLPSNRIRTNSTIYLGFSKVHWITVRSCQKMLRYFVPEQLIFKCIGVPVVGDEYQSNFMLDNDCVTSLNVVWWRLKTKIVLSKLNYFLTLIFWNFFSSCICQDLFSAWLSLLLAKFLLPFFYNFRAWIQRLLPVYVDSRPPTL